MNQREFEYIGNILWERHLKWVADPKHAEAVAFYNSFFEDVNSLGYDLYWSNQIQLTTFNGDTRIFPIVKKHIEYWEEHGYDKEYRFDLDFALNSFIQAMAHKNFNIATEYLMNKYREGVEKDLSNTVMEGYISTICRIKDKRYINEYIELLKMRPFEKNLAYIAILLGKLKVKEAEDALIELIDARAELKGGGKEEKFYAAGCHLWPSKEAVTALGAIKSEKALPKLRECLCAENLTDFIVNPEALYRGHVGKRERMWHVNDMISRARKAIFLITGEKVK